MSACKACGLPIKWTRIEGKWFCFNEGTTVSHLDACSQARTARIVLTGKAFTSKYEAGYETTLRKSGVLLMRQHKKAIAGTGFKLSGTCKQCVPPWEACPNGCADEINQPRRTA